MNPLNTQIIVPQLVISHGKFREYDGFQYEKLKGINQGASKIVWRGQIDNKMVAIVKVVLDENDPYKKRATIIHELKMRDLLKEGEGFSTVQKVFQLSSRKDPKKTKIIWIEPYFKSDLYDAIDDLPQTHIRKVILLVQKAIKYAHSKNIVLADLKPENILVDYDLDKDQLKIALIDFSGSYLEGSLPPCNGTTVQYASPEKVESPRTYPPKSTDVWSFGIIIIFCLSKRSFSFPYDLAKQKGLTSDKFKEFYRSYEVPPYDLRPDILRMLEVDPKKRATITEVLKS